VKEQSKKLDEWVYRAERGFTVAALSVMSIVVFLDVIHRTFASQQNEAVEATVWLLGQFGREIEVGSDAYQSLETVLPPLTWAAFIGLAFFAIQSANARDRVPVLRAFAYAVFGVVAAYGLIQLFIKLVPNGLIWSQPLALVLTLWVGFIAASMCTYDNKHLKVEAVQRLLPPRAKPYIVATSGFLTAGVCLTLMWLSLRYVVFNYGEYVGAQGQGGLVNGLDVPKYQAFLVLPVAFFLMTLRFTARAVAAFRGELPQEPALEGLEPGKRAGRKPSEVPTEVSGKEPRPVTKRPPSEVPTEVVEVGRPGSGDVPPSKVAADPKGKTKGEAGKKGDGGDDE
jgi:TRAP-type C4-dicarboxylate transport system permease small subunit